MKLIIDNSIYDMSRQQADKVLKVASEQIPLGVYAIEKDGIVELRNDKCKNKLQLKRLIQEFNVKGFNVYSNGG